MSEPSPLRHDPSHGPDVVSPASSSTRWLTVPNLLSLSRIPLAIVAAVAVLQGAYVTASVAFVIAILTDAIDGPIARSRNQASALGGLFDHGSDAFFVTLLLGAWAYVGLIPICLPPLVALAFLQYMLDSDALRGQQLRTSRIGRSNGVAYYVIAGTATLRAGLDAQWLDATLVRGLAWAFILLTLVSMVDRAISYLRVRAAARAATNSAE